MERDVLFFVFYRKNVREDRSDICFLRIENRSDMRTGE
jgi:hypothetical protein